MIKYNRIHPPGSSSGEQECHGLAPNDVGNISLESFYDRGKKTNDQRRNSGFVLRRPQILEPGLETFSSDSC